MTPGTFSMPGEKGRNEGMKRRFFQLEDKKARKKHTEFWCCSGFFIIFIIYIQILE